MEFYGNYISKCPNQKKKISPVLANRLLSSLSNKLEHFNNEPETPCRTYQISSIKCKVLEKLYLVARTRKHVSGNKYHVTSIR